MKSCIRVWLLSAMALCVLAATVYSESAVDERTTDWGAPHPIIVPSDGGNLKGIVRLRALPKKEGNDKDPLEARMPEVKGKSVFVPSKNLLWIGAPEYDHFIVMKDQIVAFYPTAGADLSLSLVRAPVPKSADADKALREEMDELFEKMAGRPLRYQYWISLRKLFGQDAFANDRDPRTYSVPNISGISVGPGKMIITLLENNGKKSTLTFDDELRVIAVAQEGHAIALPQPVVPQKLTTDKD